jgi:predicted phage tail protein
MKTVKVYGALRKRLGGQLRFDFENVQNPAQAIKALIVNFPGLDKWLAESHEHGVAYKVTVGKEIVDEEDGSALFKPWTAKDVFKIVPVLTGAGRGWGRILGGAFLVAASIFAGPAVGGFLGLGGAGIIGATAAHAIGWIGVSLVLGGVSQMLSPTAPFGPSDPTQLESFTFSGITNTSRQDMCIPVCYGRVYTGAITLSFGLRAHPTA